MAKKTNNNSVSGSRRSSARKVEIIGISLIAIAALIGFVFFHIHQRTISTFRI